MKRIMLITLILLLFVSCSAVHAENSMDDTMMADNTLIDENNDIDLSESVLEKASDFGDANNLEINESVLADADEGEYVDASEAYGYLNAFRTEENAWYWNADDSTQSHVNTNDTVWLKPVERDVELENTAKIRAKEISEYFSHERPDGSMCFSIFPDGLLDYGENIAYGYEDSFAVTEGWKETNESYEGQGHRRTMLQASFNYVGIAGYKVDGVIYWVQNFGCRYDPKDVSAVSRLNFQNNTLNPKFSIELPSYASGGFDVYVNGTLFASKQISNGNAEISVCGLNQASYEVFLSYSGDYNCKPMNSSQTVVIPDHEAPSGTLSFNHLNTLVLMAENEIKLENDYAYSADTDSALAQGIEIGKNLIIDGQGHTIDAGNLARIFRAYSFDLTIKNIRMINGNSNLPDEKRYYDYSTYGVTAYYNLPSNRNGSAIFSYSRLSIVNSTFSNNTALYGGAIYSFSKMDIANSSFTENGADDGGAIFSRDEVFITNTTFTDNYAVDIGGAVHSPSIIESNNSIFKNNYNQAISAGQFKGANNTFINHEYVDLFANASHSNGIVTLNGNYDAHGTILINASNVIIDGRGYTIDAKGKSRLFNITGDNVTVKNLRFINGKSVRDGGAIHVSSSCITIINSTFENCIAQNGGVLYGNLTNITVINSTFTSNMINDFSGSQIALGGAIRTENGTVSLLNSVFTNNTSLDGGAISTEYGFVSIIDSCFEKNSALVYAGGAVSSGAGVNATNSVFRNNYAPAYGGAIFCWDVSKTHIRDSIFENNTSNHYGGAVSAAVGLEIINSLFTDNSATHYGGAITLWGNLTVKDSNFTCNSAQVAGAIFDLSKNSTVSITDSNFIKNTQNTNGALYLTANSFISDSSFIGNGAKDGTTGAIENAQNMTVSNCIFKNNYAVRSWGNSVGGAISNYGENLNVVNSVFESNSAYSGGAIANFAGNANIYSSNFTNNSAVLGGACFNYDENCNLLASDSIFENNSAQDGGALYQADAFNSKFTQNKASNIASAMYGTSNTAEKCDFIRNVDYVQGPTSGVTATDCISKDNRLIVKAYFSTFFMGSAYYQEDLLYIFFLNSQNSIEISDATITLRAYKNNALVDEFEFLSGNGWIVNITEGNYTFQFSVENQDYEADAVNETVTVIKKEKANVNIEMENSTYLDVTSANITSNLDGSITVYLDDYYVEDLNIMANEPLHLEYNYISAGNHTLSIAMTPSNYNYDTKTFARNFTVFKKPTSIALNVENATDAEAVIVKLNSSDYGNVNVRMGSIEESTYLIPGVEAEIVLGVLDVGTYTVVATYPGDENFAESSASKTFNVFRQFSADDISVSHNQSDVIISLPNDLTGKVTFSIAGENLSANVIGGIADIKLPVLADGDYAYTIAYSGNGKYLPFASSGVLKINKTLPHALLIPDVRMPNLNDGLDVGYVIVSVPKDVDATVALSISGETYVFDVVNGIATVILPDLADGVYDYSITYYPQSKYGNYTDIGILTVNRTSANSSDEKPVPEIVIPPFDKPSSDGAVIVSLPGDATGKVTLSINGRDYDYPVENGMAKVIIPDLGDGSYQYTITYSGDGRYSSFVDKGTLNRQSPNVDPVISASNAKVTYAAGSYYTIKVNGTDGKPADGASVVITVKGKTFKTLKTANGVAKFKVDSVPGTYVMTITSLDKSLERTLTVNHLVTLKSVTVKKSAKKLVLQATLGKINGKYLKNKKIAFKFNGKKYTAKTNKKGVAKVTIKSSVLKKLKAGKKVTYQATYLKDTVKKTVKVKK